MSRGQKLILIGLSAIVLGLLLLVLSFNYYISGTDINYSFLNTTTIVNKNESFSREIDDVIPGINMTIKVVAEPSEIPMSIKITQEISRNNNTLVKVLHNSQCY